MSAILTMLFAGLGRRFAYWGAIVAAVGVAIWILLRQGKHAAEADLAIRRADARVRALQTSKDTALNKTAEFASENSGRLGGSRSDIA